MYTRILNLRGFLNNNCGIIYTLLWWFFVKHHYSAGKQHGTCLQRRFKSVCASTQSDQRLSFQPEEMLNSWLPIERPLETQIRQRDCAVWSEPSMGAHAILCLLLDTAPFLFERWLLEKKICLYLIIYHVILALWILMDLHRLAPVSNVIFCSKTDNLSQMAIYNL